MQTLLQKMLLVLLFPDTTRKPRAGEQEGKGMLQTVKSVFDSDSCVIFLSDNVSHVAF